MRPLRTKEAKERYFRALMESRKRVAESGVFDLKGMEYGLRRDVCKPWNPCPVLVKVYARLGLHRYNFIHGTKFELVRVRKYVMTTGAAAASYFITSYAMDPTTSTSSSSSSSSLRTFQTSVSEQSYGSFILTCGIARLRGDMTRPYSRPDNELYCKLGRSLPEWPPLNPFQNRNRFHVVKESDNDWIRLYLELAVATTYRHGEARDYYPSNLEIVKAAREDIVNEEGPNADDNTIIVYIRYRDLCEARVGKDAAAADRVAIIRRRFNQVTGWFSLEGQTQSSESIIIPPKKVKKNQKRLFRQRLGIHKPWLLSFPRVCKSYKNRRARCGLDRHMHKTRWRLQVIQKP